MFLLVDGNNFYVSCERVFNPTLRHKPVVVLSNNDGCIVARSNEVKQLGIKMGTPLFKCKDILTRHKVAILSSNYPLYADLSQRVVEILKRYTPDIEVYSIDESFLWISTKHIYKLSVEIRRHVKKEVGIPVGIGIGKTKTLAKIANKLSKKMASGVCHIHEFDKQKLLKTIPVEDLWGIGKGFKSRLNKLRIYTALQLKEAPAPLIRKRLHVWGERMQLELNDVSCIPLNPHKEPNQSIISSKSFGQKIKRDDYLAAALTHNIQTAAEKCRAQKLKVKKITVFLMSNRFKEADYYHEHYIELPHYSSSASYIAQHAIVGLKKIKKNDIDYCKSGIILHDLVSEAHIQEPLTLNALPSATQVSQAKQDTLMKAFDQINQKWGKSTIKLAVSHTDRKPWLMKQKALSKSYTTQWDKLLQVN